VLLSRTGLPPRTEWDRPTDPATAERIRDVRYLERLGVSVHTPCADVADLSAMTALRDGLLRSLPPVQGIVHAAGTSGGGLLSHTTTDDFRHALRPKLGGALVLHRLFPPGSVDFLVLFSSCGHLLGLPGQAAYGAANTCLDFLAQHRHHHADDTLSIAWTSWKSLGMGDNPTVEAELAARSIGLVSAHQALSAWEFSARHTDPYAVVMPLRAARPGTNTASLLSELAFPEPDTHRPSGPPTGFEQMNPTELRTALHAVVRLAVTQATGIPDDELDDNVPLPDYGVDSVMSLAVRNRLNTATGLALSGTVLWRHPTISALVTFTAGQFTSPIGDETDEATP
jgi:6-methylsalicylic acid synthase